MLKLKLFDLMRTFALKIVRATDHHTNRDADISRTTEILTAITAGTVTGEQLNTLVRVQSGAVKPWKDVTQQELEQLRRTHAL